VSLHISLASYVATDATDPRRDPYNPSHLCSPRFLADPFLMAV